MCSGALLSNYLCVTSPICPSRHYVCTSRHPHVHPGTAAVNQTACNFPIKGRAFAIALHSKPEKPTVNISNRNYKISKIVCSILDLRVWTDRAAVSAARSLSLCIWWRAKMDLGPIRSVKWSVTVDLHWPRGLYSCLYTVLKSCDPSSSIRFTSGLKSLGRVAHAPTNVSPVVVLPSNLFWKSSSEQSLWWLNDTSRGLNPISINVIFWIFP